MQWNTPEWLWTAGILLPVLVLAAALADRTRGRRLQRFAAARLLPSLAASASPARRWVKRLLLLGGLTALLVALARPQWGYVYEEKRARGIDILFALDVSKSMLAEDIRPNRLARAQLAILDLLEDLRGDRVGLIAFAGSAFLQCPLTLDHDAFRQTLRALEPGVIPRGGTDLAAALAEAQGTYRESAGDKVLVLITDGEDLAEEGLAQAEAAAKAGVTVFTVGVGSATGELIPVRAEDGSVEYLRDEAGDPVQTRLDEDTLREIARATGGFYAPLGPTGTGLRSVYARGLSVLDPEAREDRLSRVPLERFQWPLGLAVLLLAAEPLLSNRRRRTGGGSPPVVALLLAGGIAFGTAPDLAANPQEAAELYAGEQYEAAQPLWDEAVTRRPEDSRLRLNQGKNLYQQKHYEEALRAYGQSLRTGDLDLQARAYFERANTLFRLGESTLQEQDFEQVQEHWEAAVQDYENALALHPEHEDAATNLETVRTKLDALEKYIEQLRQQQQQQQGDSSEENEDEQQQDDTQQDPSDGQSGDSQQQQQDGSQNPQQGESSQPQEGSQGDSQQQQDREQQNQGSRDSEQSAEGEESSQAQSEPSEDGGEQEQEASAGQPQEGEEAQTARATPEGALTREEAEMLLNALRAQEKQLPAGLLYRQKEGSAPANPQRDW